MANKQYERVNWAAYPNKSTPITAENLNRMDKGIDDLDTRTTNLENRQDNYESDMTDVKSDVLELTDSLSGITECLSDSYKIMARNLPNIPGNGEITSLVADITSQYPSAIWIKAQCNMASIDGSGRSFDTSIYFLGSDTSRIFVLSKRDDNVIIVPSSAIVLYAIPMDLN